MTTKQATDQHGRGTWITLWLVILGALLYGITVFQYDYFGAMKRGESGQAAIQMLDQMRRPFLALKQAELRLLQSRGDASTLSDIESAIRDGHQKLSEYLQIASYNEDVRKEVVLLEASFSAWVSLELELMRTREFLAVEPGILTEHRELDALRNRNTSAFLAVMDALGGGENPIHHDIEAGAAAIHGLLVSSLTFVLYLIGLTFWREWVRHRREYLYIVQKENEKYTVFRSMLDATNHILRNFLNNMQLFHMEAEKSKDFSNDILKLYDVVIDETVRQIRNLEELQNPSKENIEETRKKFPEIFLNSS